MAKTKKVEEATIVEDKTKEKSKSKHKKKSTVHTVKPTVKYEKALFIQRFAAFILDIFIVSFVASLLAYPFLDMDSIQKLDDSSTEVAEKFLAQDISEDEYISESIGISYELARQQGLLSLITIFLNILYFVVFQIYNNGQTLGKQLLKIKVVSKDDQPLTVNQMIFRAAIINSILISMVNFAILIFANQYTYFYTVAVLELIQFMIIAISGFMVMFGERRQGIHDLIAHTDVVKCDVVEEMETCEN